MISWNRYGGYEVSTAGDSRFSAFNAILPDNRSIEEHYQCDIKGYDIGGKNWRKGKGNPPLDKSKDLWKEYLALWEIWSDNNPELIDELYTKIGSNGILSDRFANTMINQARALSIILNRKFNSLSQFYE